MPLRAMAVFHTLIAHHTMQASLHPEMPVNALSKGYRAVDWVVIYASLSAQVSCQT